MKEIGMLSVLVAAAVLMVCVVGYFNYAGEQGRRDCVATASASGWTAEEAYLACR